MSDISLVEYMRFLASNGVSLAALGIHDVALRRDDTLRAATLLRTARVPILGGDVYFRRANRIEYAYANWHADAKSTEDRDTYLHRSWEMTEKYVKEFPDAQGTEILFSLVTGESKRGQS